MADIDRKKGLVLSLVATAVFGAVVVLATLNREASVAAVALDDAPAPTPEYGQRLLRNDQHLGTGQLGRSALQYSGNGLDCASCHWKAAPHRVRCPSGGTAQRYPVLGEGTVANATCATASTAAWSAAWRASPCRATAWK